MGQSCTALLDACVLYQAPLRDLLLRLALVDLFKAIWTDEIHEEWIRNLLSNRRDLRKERLLRTRDLMNRHIRDSLVEKYSYLIPTLHLPDENDRHVLAAAIKGGANSIVTYNLSDFPESEVGKYGIIVKHPDTFIRGLFDTSPDLVCWAMRHQLESLTDPPVTPADLLTRFESLGLVQTATVLRTCPPTLP